jgi:hypothetical protein
MGSNSEDWVTQSEAAEKSGKSLAAINNLVRRGRIASKEIYGKTLVSLSEVQDYDVTPGRPAKGKADPAAKTIKKKGGRK